MFVVSSTPKHPKLATCRQLIVHEVHRPILVRGDGLGHGTAMQTQSLRPTRTHAHLQAFQAIEPMDPVSSVFPTLPSEHDPDPFIAEPGSSMSDLPDPHAQRDRMSADVPFTDAAWSRSVLHAVRSNAEMHPSTGVTGVGLAALPWQERERRRPTPNSTIGSTARYANS